jgi:hypothetical protein
MGAYATTEHAESSNPARSLAEPAVPQPQALADVGFRYVEIVLWLKNGVIGKL